MSSLPKTCRISKGTTLEELANHFNLTKEQLKRYHNTYCPLDDLIGYDIPEHVTIIYVPPLDAESREKIFNPKSGNFLSFKSKNTLDNKQNYKKRYGIIQKIFHNDEEELKIHYETEIIKNKNTVQISRSQVYLNNKVPDLVIEQLADKIGSIFYPFELGLHENGSINTLVNFKEIQNRWKILKPQLEEYYKGEIANELLASTNKRITQKSITEQVHNSLFFTLYFLPLYKTFDENKSLNLSIEIPIFKNSTRALFEIDLKLEEKISKTHKFIIKASGKSTSGKISDEIEKENTSPITDGKIQPKNSSYFDFIYKLNSKDNSIFAIYGELGVQFPDCMKKISLECYEQP
ncbi:hypothetical protein [Chryseobacterium oryctis]|uniref:LysM domain-containing protein n=1 Tax=Chryseobacterium oryctis TaxID=2952618 RepID=A0ABT3HMT7_9FLAO|nr:hypothetical protein [Chryseobacterium oryctis]MCW3161092.1 hypothetical protein [Chryseobacterium oryctis]